MPRLRVRYTNMHKMLGCRDVVGATSPLKDGIQKDDPAPVIHARFGPILFRCCRLVQASSSSGNRLALGLCLCSLLGFVNSQEFSLPTRSVSAFAKLNVLPKNSAVCQCLQVDSGHPDADLRSLQGLECIKRHGTSFNVHDACLP